MLRDSVSGGLSGIHDLERLMSRIVYGSSNARELRSLAAALSRLPGLQRVPEKRAFRAFGVSSRADRPPGRCV